MLDYEHIVDDGRPSYWERPKTTRRYLHPPKARKLITLWAEGKVVYGNTDWYESHLTYHEEQAVVFWPVWYKSFRPFDYRKTENYILRDGAPIHGLRYSFGGIDIEEEAFSDTKEIPTCFIRFRYTNRAPYPVKFKDLGFVIRKGSEKRMCYGAPDGYSTYLPEVSAVTSIPVSFSMEGDTLRDGCSYVRIQSEKPYTYDEETGVLKFQLALDEGETFDLTVSIGEGDPFAFSYEEEREKALSFWEKQMARIDRLPVKIQNDPEKIRIIQNFTVQFLQCFCRYTGEPWYIFRQGGLQRHIWPWDAMPALEALGRIGDFTEELDEVFYTYFNVMQQPDGHIENLGIQWSSNTGCCLYSLAVYCLQKDDPAYWRSYREKALAAFRNIESLRKSSYTIEGAVGGLMPPLRSSDWEEVLQHWTFTDPYNIAAYKILIKAAERFSDPMLPEIRSAYDEYRNVCLETLKKLVDLSGTDPVRLPLTPDGKDLGLLSNFYAYLQHATLPLMIDDLLPESLLDRIKTWGESIRLFERGLYGKLPGADGNTHIFYTTAPEYAWFFLFLRRGRVEEAKEILSSLLTYSMTAEYYMIERYDNRDPYFLPWSPNASAMGRTINMMLDLYRDESGPVTAISMK